MLTRFDCYLLRTIFFTSVVALIFLLTADFIIQASSDVDNLGKGHVTMTIVLLKHLLTLPEKFTLFAPAAVLIGSIMGLGQLNAQHEVTVLQAAGVARMRIARGAILFSLFTGLLSLLNSEYLSPKLHDKSQLIYNQALGKISDLSQEEGIWLQQAGEIVHIESLQADGSLHGLRFYHFQGENTEITEADSARYLAPNWQLENSRRFRVNQYESAIIPAPTEWKNALPPAMLKELSHASHADTIRELYNLTRFMAANHLDYRGESLRLWQKILTPFTMLAMVLLALPFAFGNTRSGQQGMRLVIGIFLGVGYYVISGVVANLALLLGWYPFLGASLPIIIFSILPFWLLGKR